MKFKLKICLGTKCYLFGAGDIIEHFHQLPDHLKKYFEIEGSPCLGPCQKKENETPIIMIEDKYYYGVKGENLANILQDYLKQRGII